MTFSAAEPLLGRPNPDCPTAADCTADPAALTRPVFFISTHGFWDSIIASPATETASSSAPPSTPRSASSSTRTGNRPTTAPSRTPRTGGNPGGFLGYATAWLEYQLRGNATAAGAFTGAHPELVSNPNWPGSLTK